MLSGEVDMLFRRSIAREEVADKPKPAGNSQILLKMLETGRRAEEAVGAALGPYLPGGFYL